MKTSVLVVDDDPDIRITFRQVLVAEGFDVRIASNGLDALERIVDSEPDVVILDLLMPTMSGWDVLNFLRASRSHIPVIVFSAHPDASGDLAGTVSTIRKPVSLERLLVLIQSIEANIPARA